MESVLRSDPRISEARKLAMIGAVTPQVNPRRGRCSPWSGCRRFAYRVVGTRLGKWENWPKPQQQREATAGRERGKTKAENEKIRKSKRAGKRESGKEEEQSRKQKPPHSGVSVSVYLCDRDYKKKARSLSALTFGPSHQTACISPKTETNQKLIQKINLKSKSQIEQVHGIRKAFFLFFFAVFEKLQRTEKRGIVVSKVHFAL